MKLALCAGSFVEDIRKKRITLEEVLRLAGEYAFPAVEIREDLLGEKAKELPQIRVLAEKLNIELVYASKIWPLNNDVAKMEEAASNTLVGIEDARLLGADTYKIGFGPIDSLLDLGEKQYSVFNSIVESAEKRKVTVCLENTNRELGGRPNLLREFLQRVDSAYIKTCFDSGNFALWGQDPVEAARELTDFIGYVHVKDLKKGESDTTWLGNGDIDFPRLFESFRTQGYEGYICFEFLMSVDRLEEIRKSLDYVFSILS